MNSTSHTQPERAPESVPESVPQAKRIVAQVTAEVITGAAGEPDYAVRYDVPPGLTSETLQMLRASILQLEMRLANDIRKQFEQNQKAPPGRCLPAFLLYL